MLKKSSWRTKKGDLTYTWHQRSDLKWGKGHRNLRSNQHCGIMPRASTERTVSETVKNEYQLSLKESVKGNDDGAKELPCKKTGRPLLATWQWVGSTSPRVCKIHAQQRDCCQHYNSYGCSRRHHKKQRCQFVKQWWIWRHWNNQVTGPKFIEPLGTVKWKACNKNKITPEHFEIVLFPDHFFPFLFVVAE